MLEQLAVRPGHQVLEIGSGTGWNAALLARLVGPAGAVTTVDIEPEVAEQAARNLVAAGIRTVRVVPGRRGRGVAGRRTVRPDHPDRGGTGPGAGLVGAAGRGRPAGAAAVAARQPAVGGVRACPGSGRRRDPDHLESVSIVDCGFMPLQGELAGDDPVRPLGRPGLFLLLDDPRPVDAAALLAALDAGALVATTVPVSRREALTGLRVWLALYEPDAGDLVVLRDERQSPMPVLVADGALAVLVPLRGGRTTEARGYGPGADAVAGRLLGHVRAWDGRRAAQLGGAAHPGVPGRHRSARTEHRPAAHALRGRLDPVRGAGRRSVLPIHPSELVRIGDRVDPGDPIAVRVEARGHVSRDDLPRGIQEELTRCLRPTSPLGSGAW